MARMKNEYILHIAVLTNSAVHRGLHKYVASFATESHSNVVRKHVRTGSRPLHRPFPLYVEAGSSYISVRPPVDEASSKGIRVLHPVTHARPHALASTHRRTNACVQYHLPCPA